MATDINLIRAKVQDYISEFGQVDLLPGGALSFAYESTRVFVDLLVSDEPVSVSVEVQAPVALGVTLSPALWEGIGRRNASLTFGAFIVYEKEAQADVIFRYAILADFLDRQELLNAIVSVVATADAADEEIVGQFGGCRFVDMGSE